MPKAHQAARDETKMLLQDKLDALKAECLAKAPPEVTLVRQRAVEGLAASGLAERAMHAGAQAPPFPLRDGYGGAAFSSPEALRRGPIVLVFYRGKWCPYCNIDLRAIEAASHDIRSLGASLVAVSQQTRTGWSGHRPRLWHDGSVAGTAGVRPRGLVSRRH